MGTVFMHSVVSVDGFIADKNDGVGPLHDWYFNGDTPLTGDIGSRFKVPRASAPYVRSMWARIGAIVMGRHLFDHVNGWEGRPPTGDHVVVVSHRPKPEGWHPEASYHFVDDVTAAIAKARELAGERDIAVNAGEVGGQIFAAGLVDEVAMDVVPVVFGSGKRYFGDVDGQHLLEDPHVVIQAERVLHLVYKVREARPAASADGGSVVLAASNGDVVIGSTARTGDVHIGSATDDGGPDPTPPPTPIIRD